MNINQQEEITKLNHIQINGKKYPVVYALKLEPHTEIKCPFCEKIHYHGANSANSFKVSHCDFGGIEQQYFILPYLLKTTLGKTAKNTPPLTDEEKKKYLNSP